MAAQIPGLQDLQLGGRSFGGRRSLPDMASRYESRTLIPAFNWQQHVIAPGMRSCP